MTKFRSSIVERPSDLAALRDLWRSWAPTPFQSPEWMLAWWSAFETSASRLNVVVVHDQDDCPIGLAPLFVRDHWALGRSLKFLGSGRACSDFQTLLAAPGQGAVVAAAVAQCLVQVQSRQGWSYVELEGTTQSDATIDSFVAEMRKHQCVVQTTELENTWRLDLSAGWEGFLYNLSKTQKRQVRNLVNRFDKCDDLQLEIVNDAPTAQALLSVCCDLHQRRWNSVGEPGCFADPRFTAFIQRATEELGSRAQIKLAILKERGLPIACHIFYSDSQRNLFQYQSGRDPNCDAGRIGQILNAVTVRAVCAEGVQFIDLLRGDEVYKGRLGAVAAKNYRTRIVAPALLPRLRHNAWSLGRGFKRGLQSLRQRPSVVPTGDAQAESPVESQL